MTERENGMANGVMLAPQLLADSDARARALAARSFLVEAPAGAGKTELLTQRYLALLAVVDDPEEIIAITFTNKAAAEMRNRVLSSLQQVADGVPFKEAHRAQTYALGERALARSAARGWNLLAQPARLRMLTIDALCASLARQMPLLSRIGAAAQVSDDPGALYEEAARLAVEKLEGDDPVLADGVAASLAQLDNNAGRLVTLLAHMLARRDQWLRHGVRDGEDTVVDNAAVLRVLVERDMQCAAGALSQGTQARLIPLVAYALDNAADSLLPLADWDAPLAPHWEALGQWQALARLLLTASGTVRKSVTVRDGFPPGAAGKPHKDEMLAILAELAEGELAQTLGALLGYPEIGVSSDEQNIVAAYARLLKQAVGELRCVFSERREVDFIEVAESALTALGESDAPSDLALRLDYRISHLLVDEFQDTSPTQIRLLERLSAGWADGDGRTLFCVGDPMQSVYRFRKADVGLFVAAGRSGIGGVQLETLRLYRNNRSCPAIVDWVNAHFAGIFAAADDVTRGAVAYRPSVATREAQDGAGVEIVPTLCAADVEAEVAEAHEASEVLRLVDATWAQDPNRSIAVLVRARSHLAPLIAEIRRNRPALRFQAVDVEPLGGRQWVQDLLLLTRALLQLADRVNWLALLRSPLCGLSLADLHALAANSREQTLWSLMYDTIRLAALSADGVARVEHLRSVVASALAYRGRQSLSRWIAGVWMQLGGAAGLPDAAALEDCNAYLHLIEQLESHDFWLDRLAEDLDGLYAGADPAPEAERLKLMTIHKAKGLQFDTVILPALHRQTRGGADMPLLLWDEVVIEGAGSRTIVAPLPKRRGGAPENTAYDVLRRLERERDASESVRVLYVAVTRAERVAYLLGAVWRDAADTGVKSPRAGTPLALLWPQVARQWESRAVDLPGDTHMPTGTDGAEFVPQFLRLRHVAGPGSLQLEAKPEAENRTADLIGDAVKQSGEDDESTGGGAPVALVAQRRVDALVGTLAHRYLEWIARDGLAAWPAGRVETLQPQMSDWFVASGLTRAAANVAAEEVSGMLATTMASPDGRRVLSAKGEAELALVRADESGARLHVLDRCFVADGVRWLIDYKTTKVNSNDRLKLIELAETHREQLTRYAALFPRDEYPVRCAVMFVRNGLLLALSGEF